MRNKKNILIEQLERKLVHFKDAGKVLVPEKGWVNAIRTTLNMTREQLGHKLDMTKGAIQKIEDREVTGQISLKKLKDVGDALDMNLVYGFIPKDGSIQNLIHLKAEKLARKIVLRANQTMILEDQGIHEDKIEMAIKELTEEFKREINKALWD